MLRLLLLPPLRFYIGPDGPVQTLSLSLVEDQMTKRLWRIGPPYIADSKFQETAKHKPGQYQ